MAVFIGTNAADQIRPGAPLFDMGVDFTTTDFSGDDVILGEDGDDDLRGDAGDDTIVGGQGLDELYGGTGNDLLVGGAGDDRFEDFSGSDAFHGGAGNDQFLGTHLTTVYGGTGFDELLVISAFSLSLNLATGVTNVGGTRVTGIEYLALSGGNDTVQAAATGITIFAGGGNDSLTGGDASDVLNGEIGTDRLFGGGSDDSLFGGADSDVLSGDDGDDYLDGGEGTNAVSGGTGNDFVLFGAGAHDGGADTDTLDASVLTAPWRVDMQTGQTNIAGSTVSTFEVLISGSGDDTLIGSVFADRIHGGLGEDRFEEDVSGDSLFGGGDNDTFAVSWFGAALLDGGDGLFDALDLSAFAFDTTIDLSAQVATNDAATAVVIGIEQVYAGSGVDDLRGSEDANTLDGGDGDDRLDGRGGDDALFGGAGNDTIHAGTGVDIVLGNDGDDTVFLTAGGQAFAEGGTGTDTLDTTGRGFGILVDLVNAATSEGDNITQFENVVAGAGNDTLVGNNRANALYGGDGDDSLSGGGGLNALYGGGGHDRIVAFFDFAEVVDGGTGSDTLDLRGNPGAVSVNLTTGETHVGAAHVTGIENLLTPGGNDTVTGSNLANRIETGAGFDLVNGGGGRDLLLGGTENDRLSGGNGDDTVQGQDGNDQITGGAGLDILIGGGGRDRFVFVAASDSVGATADILRGGDGAPAFQGAGAAAGDLIDLSGIDANTGVAGNDGFAFGGSQPQFLMLIDEGTATVVLGNTDGDFDFEFRLVIEDGAVLASAYTAADFVL